VVLVDEAERCERRGDKGPKEDGRFQKSSDLSRDYDVTFGESATKKWIRNAS
jgi:hypothetical protein